MFLRSICAFLLFGFFSFTGFAGELIEKEGLNYYNEGVAAQKRGDYSEAIFSYQKSIIISSSDAHYKHLAFNNLGVIFAIQRDRERAEEYFKKALIAKPDYLAPRLNLGLMYDNIFGDDKTKEYWYSIIKYIKPKNFIIEDDIGEDE